jgi:uncharacterized protein YlzI (FlbEa/FlbD family)
MAENNTQTGKFGELSGNWKGGVYIKDYFCKDCSKKISYQSGRLGRGICRSCSSRKRKHSELSKKKCSITKLGSKNPMWKGGVSSVINLLRESQTGRLWRTSVFKRDNYTCQRCGQRGGNLNAHHIKSFTHFPETRFTLNNGVTMCKKCHKEEHKNNGKTKNKKTQRIKSKQLLRDIVKDFNSKIPNWGWVD